MEGWSIINASSPGEQMDLQRALPQAQEPPNTQKVSQNFIRISLSSEPID